jgi:hypothetical protein
VVAALKKPGNQASFEKAYFQIVHHLTPIFATGHITAAAVDGGAVENEARTIFKANLDLNKYASPKCTLGFHRAAMLLLQ